MTNNLFIYKIVFLITLNTAACYPIFQNMPLQNVQPSYNNQHQTTNYNINKEDWRQNQMSNSNVIKSKLGSLLLELKKEIIAKNSLLRHIHNTYKSNVFYKLGYIVSEINNTIDTYAQVDKMAQPKKVDEAVLHSYEQHMFPQLRGANTYLTEVLGVVTDLVAEHKKSFSLSKPGMEPEISWSYYDQDMD